MSATVRAAGGVVVRTRDGRSEVLVVHRPRYDDWSFPKGKCEPGESDEDAARREVWEETGCQCRLLEELPTVRYIDNRGRPKQVRWWRMEVRHDEPNVPNEEVDALRWCSADEAAGLLTYQQDRDLLDAVGALR